MSRSLPDRPDLDHLRRQAKALRDAARAGDAEALARITRYAPVRTDAPVALSAAQWVIAREYGFASWARLKVEVLDRAMGLPERADAFVRASVTGRLADAARLLEPKVARFDLRTAAVLGDVERVAELLPTYQMGAGWPPLLYVCHSHWHLIEPARSAGLVAVARLLLDAGASPDTGNGRRIRGGGYRSALYGAAGIANHPALVALLLSRGAHTDDGESLYHSVRFRDHACLRLLLAHGARVEWTNAVAAAAEDGDVEAVRLLLDAGGDPGRAPTAHLADRSVHPLAVAADAAVVDVLLTAGADPNAVTDDGVSVVRRAVRRGDGASAASLRRAGAVDDVTPVDEFLGACVRGEHGGAVPAELSDVDRAELVGAVGFASADAVAGMLDLGLLLADRDDGGSTALHAAAYAGRADVVRLLLARGAVVDAPDERWDATPLCFATVGSGESERDGDWAGVVRALVAAGASLTGVWVGDKPPSAEVAGVLAEFGVTGPDDPVVVPVDPDVLRSVAARLRDALARGDLDALGELLDPGLRWGSCTNREQALAWYRSRWGDRIAAEVLDVVIGDDAVLVELLVETERLWQAYRVADGAIVEIRPVEADLV